MKTWYYAVEVPHWILALIWSHALIACAMFAYLFSLPSEMQRPSTAALAFTFLLTGVLWYVMAITPLRGFRKQFGFWPGRTAEERKATCDAVIETLRRRAAILDRLWSECDGMGLRDRIERDAILVDIEQEDERFRQTLHAASPRYAGFGVHHDSAWQTWCRPQADSIGVGEEPASPSGAAAAAVSA